MSITEKIIVTDTNIIKDLNNANILDKFVGLDNVYISDLVKNDEVNFKTGNLEIINKFKTLKITEEQLIEVSTLASKESKLSIYDVINYILARDNDGVLATGDDRLRKYSLENGVKVIRTLKIIRLLKEKNIISCREAIKACILLKKCKKTRIPEEDINNLIEEFKTELVIV